MVKLLSLIVVGILFSIHSPALASLDCNFSCRSIPTADNILFQFGPIQDENLITASELEILIWNVHKAKDKGFDRDLAEFAKTADLLVIQEAKNTAPFMNLSEWSWWMGTSFFMKDDHRTGVATAAKVQPTFRDFRQTKDREPFVKTPKVQLITRYLWNDPELPELLVVNIHGINWQGDDALSRQLKQVEDVIKNHPGPVVYGGDFNTKNNDRMELMAKFAKRTGMAIVPLERDERSNKLDHVLVKGVQVIKAVLFDGLKSSDHPAIQLTIKRSLPQSQI